MHGGAKRGTRVRKPNDRLRVAFVLPSLVRAGAETQTVNLVNGLADRAFEKHLFVFESNMDQADRVRQPGVALHHVSRRSKFDLAPVRALARLIDEKEIDVLHCSLQIALFMGWCARRVSRRKPRLLVALHTTHNRSRREDMFDLLLFQWLMRSCNRIICVCQAQERHWQNKYAFLRGRTQVIYNGVDTEFFSPDTVSDAGAKLRRELGIAPDAVVACCIAAFRPEKGHDILLRAFARALESEVDAYLLLAGAGPRLSEIEALVTELGLNQRVEFLGIRADVRPILAAADVSVIASTAVETFSIAMLESLSMGVPVIATDIGGAGEMVFPDETGLLVPCGDPESLARAMTKMFGQPAACAAMGRKGRQLVMRQFSEEMMLSRTTDLLVEHG
ncbi:MAG: glycosyltransferase family 4 protein [Gammaproteobacteria bacterium]|nr:glycosyltransferase family 4 protein [Gammaproteobacteria bacterium]